MGKKVRNYKVRLSDWFTLILLSLFIKLNIFKFANIFCIFDSNSFKFHEKDKKSYYKNECIHEFTVWIQSNGNYYDANITKVIVEECSFYNVPFNLNKIKKKKKDNDNNNDNDNDVDSKGNFINGVSFTNIPGALLP